METVRAFLAMNKGHKNQEETLIPFDCNLVRCSGNLSVPSTVFDRCLYDYSLPVYSREIVHLRAEYTVNLCVCL